MPTIPLDIAALMPQADWACLPPDIHRRFTPGHPSTIYRGAVTITRTKIGAFFARLAALFGTPLPLCDGADIPAEVRVFPSGGGGIVWERWLFPPGRPANCVRSTKILGRNGLEECCDHGLGMYLKTFESSGALVFASQSYFLTLGRFRLPVPNWLSPGACRATHQNLTAEIFHFTLEIRHPFWGRTIHQAGFFIDPAGINPPVYSAAMA